MNSDVFILLHKLRCFENVASFSEVMGQISPHF